MIKKIFLLTLLSFPLSALPLAAQDTLAQPAAPADAISAAVGQNNQAQQSLAPKTSKELPVVVLSKPKSALFGRRFEMEVELPAEAKLDLTSFDRKDFEIIKQTRNQINPRKFTLSVIAFNLGVLQFPQTTWVDARGNKFYSDTFRIETKPTKTKVKTQGLADIRPPFRPFNPWYIVFAVALAAAVFAFWRWYKNRKALAPDAPITPYTADNRPLHIIALEQIDNLLMEGLWEAQHYKLFYIRLTDILRDYFSARFNIAAHRFTTGDLIKELKRCKEFKTEIEPVSVFLKDTDYVKFAKVVPSAQERDAHIKNLRDIITETRQPLALQPSPDDVLKTDIKLFDLSEGKSEQNVKAGPEIEIIKSEKEFAQRLMDREQGLKDSYAAKPVQDKQPAQEEKQKEEPKKEEAQKEDVKKAEPKKEEIKKEEPKQEMKELFLVSRQPSRPIDLKVKSALEKQGVKYGQMAEACFNAPQVFKKTESEIKVEAEAAKKAEDAKAAKERTLP